MALPWTAEQILAFAPDASSAKAGKELSSARKWVSTGGNERALWGECQGSGKTPYQTRVDLTEPVFKCSCPSRKFPCKHGLGLFLLWEANGGQFETTEPPEWVSQWLADRDLKATRKAEAAANPPAEKTVDAKAQARRIESREAKVRVGLEELELWLHDMMRTGLAEVAGRPYRWWEDVAARLVDAQAPGLARIVREMAGLTLGHTATTSSDQHEEALHHIARLHLAIEGYRRLDTLPAATQADLKQTIGWTPREEDVLANPGTQESWLVVARRVDEEDRLRIGRTWLWGLENKCPALILQFAHGNAPIDNTLAPASVFDGELVFYPGATPLRAVVKNRCAAPRALQAIEIAGLGTSIEQAAMDYAQVLGRNPWITTWPLALSKVLCVRGDEHWTLRDTTESGREWPLPPSFAGGWKLLACSGGGPLHVWGEWNGRIFSPCAACHIEHDFLRWIAL